MIPPSSPIHFAEKVSSSSPMPCWCPGKVRAKSELSPSQPPGQRAPSHMPRRLARSSAPLNWLIATQEKKKTPTLLPFCHLLLCVQTWSTSNKHIHLPPLHTTSSHTPYSPNAPQCAHPPPYQPSPPLSLPIVNFADEIKQTNFHWCVRSGALDCVAKRKNQCCPKWEIKLNM